MPIYKGIIHVFGAILEADFMKTGIRLDCLGLDWLGLEGMTRKDVIRCVEEGY